jgi:hypothetical protein
MDEVEYQSALANLERLRPTQLSFRLSAFTFALGPRRISRNLSCKARLLADQLARIEPPPDVAAGHNALIRAVRRAASDLDELAHRKGLRTFERFEAMAEINFGEAEMRALEVRGHRLPKRSRVRRHS